MDIPKLQNDPFEPRTGASAAKAAPPAWRSRAYNRRVYFRVPGDLHGTIQVPEGVFTVTTVDLSRNGVLVVTDAPVRIGHDCRLYLYTSQGLIHAVGEVVRVEPGRIAVHLAHFHRGDQERLDRVINELL